MAIDVRTRLPNGRGQVTRRLIRLFNDATDEELDYGLRWYQDAHAWAAQTAAEHGRTTDEVAGVIAALSPRCPWPSNLRRTVEMLETGDTYGLTNGRDKARRILGGAAPLDELSGPKTRAFYSNLADPLASAEVTIDVHALNAAAGQVLSDAAAKRILGVNGGYRHVADAYRSAARVLGVAPHVTQAVVWDVWRNRFALALHVDGDPLRAGERGEGDSVDPACPVTDVTACAEAECG